MSLIYELVRSANIPVNLSRAAAAAPANFDAKRIKLNGNCTCRFRCPVAAPVSFFFCNNFISDNKSFIGGSKKGAGRQGVRGMVQVRESDAGD